MKDKMTIQEIANESGVSIATVSRVLRDLPGVSGKMSAKVHKVMDGRESFRPRIKLSNKLTRIALVAHKSDPNIDYFTAMALSGLSRFAFDYAVDVSLLIRPPELIDAAGLIGMLREHGADAAIIAYAPRDGHFLNDLEVYRKQAPVPMVMCYDQCSFLPNVISNDSQGEVELANHLLELGHRKIGYLGAVYGDEVNGPARVRLDAFVNTCRGAGIEIPENWISIQMAQKFDLGGYYESAKALLSRHPELTALYCYNDDIAFAAQRACQDLGLRVPEDISITGFDGAPHGVFGHCSLTTFKVKVEEMAYEASRLCYIMSKGMTQPAKTTVIPGQLILGESSAPPTH